jgi:hypothetical protein
MFWKEANGRRYLDRTVWVSDQSHCDEHQAKVSENSARLDARCASHPGAMSPLNAAGASGSGKRGSRIELSEGD